MIFIKEFQPENRISLKNGVNVNLCKYCSSLKESTSHRKYQYAEHHLYKVALHLYTQTSVSLHCRMVNVPPTPGTNYLHFNNTPPDVLKPNIKNVKLRFVCRCKLKIILCLYFTTDRKELLGL